MTQNLTQFLDLPVYNARGNFVGNVGNVILDIKGRNVASLLITNTNPAIVDGGRSVAVPYRWVSAVGDIVILANFPERVEISDEPQMDFEEQLEREIAA